MIDDIEQENPLAAKLAAAKAYIAERRIDVYKNQITPTNAASTDVTATWAKYRKQVMGQSVVRRFK
jgi:hypothetical protein